MTVSDRAALADLVARYARAADARDERALSELFTADAELVRPAALLRSGEPARARGNAQIARTIVAAVSRLHSTHHDVGAQTVDIAGDSATGTVYCVAHHLYRPRGGTTHELRDNAMTVRYLDTFRRESSGWKIARREAVVQDTEDQPVVNL